MGARSIDATVTAPAAEQGSLGPVGVQATLSTADELWSLPDDDLSHELVRGEHRVTPPPGAEHGRVAASVLVPLGLHVRQTARGITLAAETGFLLARDPDTRPRTRCGVRVAQAR